jgi:Holliday junction resolvase-like predicted endonuclease
MATGIRNQQTGRAGEHYVAAELNRKGAYAVTFAGNMPGIDIVASNSDRSRTIFIQVKTKRSGTWQSSIDEGFKCKPKKIDDNFWVFVDISKDDQQPDYYVVPDSWIRNNIYEEHEAYIAKKGGKRPFAPKSKHHGISVKRIQEWKDRWDILYLF